MTVVFGVSLSYDPRGSVESRLRDAAEAMETYAAEHGRYGVDAITTRRWGYDPDTDVLLDVHLRADGEHYCIEGFHPDIASPVAVYDSSVGEVEHDGTC